MNDFSWINLKISLILIAHDSLKSAIIVGLQLTSELTM